MREEGNAYKILVVKPAVKSSLKRFRLTVGIILKCIIKIESSGVDFISLTQDVDKWRAVNYMNGCKLLTKDSALWT
jgi:hypothetical protein